LLLGSLAVFALFNVMAAMAHTYAILMIARVGLAVSAATFMPAASAYAVEVTPSAQRGRALAIIYTGLTVATVVGVPTGVMIGEHFGWRYSFVIVGILAVIAWVGLWATLSPVRSPASASLAERIAIARRPDVLGALVVTVLTITGAFTVYSYLAPFLKTTANISGTSLAVVLFLFGAGSAIGNLVSGSASDRVGPRKIVMWVLGALVVLFSTLSIVGSLLPPSIARWVIVPTLAIWGFVGWSFPAAQQARFVAMAPRLAPITLSLNASAIYLGVSLGAILGAWVVAHHHVTHLGWIGASCEVMALGLMFGWARQTRRAKSPTETRTLPARALVEDQPQNT
jgi:predicted MFS family arabinose efflux permease